MSLTALLPGHSVGIAALAASIGWLSTTAGLIILTILAIQRRPGRRHLHDLAVIPVLAAAYLIQLFDSTHLLTGRPDPALRTQAILVIVFFLIAIARAWRPSTAGGRS